MTSNEPTIQVGQVRPHCDTCPKTSVPCAPVVVMGFGLRWGGIGIGFTNSLVYALPLKTVEEGRFDAIPATFDVSDFLLSFPTVSHTIDVPTPKEINAMSHAEYQTEPAKIPTIIARMEEERDLLGNLNNAILELRSRVEMVSRPTTKQDVPENAETVTARSAMEGQINDNIDFLSQMIDTVKAIAENLEI